jgi:alpha-amylase/alpha-mannosidase (GH57 family)
VNLALLWHFHQPIYRKPGTREYALPWVNFHTTKNYHQMARLAEETGYPSTFNIVPCLAEQIQDYALGRAEDPVQRSLEARPEDLTAADFERLRPFAPGEPGAAGLQLQALRSFFSPVEEIPADRKGLLGRQQEIFSGILPRFRRLWEEGRVELLTTPYYHPLTPLLFDIRAADGPDLPAVSFSYPEDGRLHLDRSRAFIHGLFGRPPSGLWPSEGGLSRAVAEAAFRSGFAFAVTDENILWKSLRCRADRRRLFAPSQSEGLSLFFRDRELSDLIGFEYHRWPERDAVTDFLRRLEDRRGVGGDDGLLVIALDGENPWRSYRENGVPFLRELYGRILDSASLRPVFFEEYLAGHGPGEEIDLVPGTWLGSFAKWIGTPAKNEGWLTLSRAREAFGSTEEILVAEGSDWFWWFGEGQPVFDKLFQSYIDAAAARAGK